MVRVTLGQELSEGSGRPAGEGAGRGQAALAPPALRAAGAPPHSPHFGRHRGHSLAPQRPPPGGGGAHGRGGRASPAQSAPRARRLRRGSLAAPGVASALAFALALAAGVGPGPRMAAPALGVPQHRHRRSERRVRGRGLRLPDVSGGWGEQPSRETEARSRGPPGWAPGPVRSRDTPGAARPWLHPGLGVPGGPLPCRT